MKPQSQSLVILLDDQVSSSRLLIELSRGDLATYYLMSKLRYQAEYVQSSLHPTNIVGGVSKYNQQGAEIDDQ